LSTSSRTIHTYTGVDGMDYRILLEADFLVNAHSDGLGRAGDPGVSGKGVPYRQRHLDP
jgi:hypothetical protein